MRSEPRDNVILLHENQWAKILMITTLTASPPPHPSPLPEGEKGFVPWQVEAVTAMPACRLDVHFRDGTSGMVDMAAVGNSDLAGVFASLRESSVFEAVHAELGAVAWPSEIGLAPDALYAMIKARGNCSLTAEGAAQ